MVPERRSLLAVPAAIAVALGSIVLFDVLDDWLVEGNPLWSTVVENGPPLVLLGGFGYAVWRLATGDYDREYVALVTRWTVVGTATMLLIGGLVVGLQLIQGEVKPAIIVIQTTIVGGIAGLLVGYNTAERAVDREEIRREKNRFEVLFQNDPAAVADLRVLDGDLVVIDGNSAFDEFFGADSEGRALFDVVPLDEDVAAAIRDHVWRQEQYTTEARLETLDGARDFTLELVPYGADAESADLRCYAILQDVTEIKTAKRDLEQTVQQLERSNEELQQFAYVASHDLQEPLRMVSSYVDLLATEYEGELDDEADEYIEFAVDGAARMQAMIDDLLQYSRVRTDALEFTETDANEVFEETRHDLELLIEEENATVTCDELPVVTADPNQLGQLFQNLVKNAIEHGGSSDEPPRVTVEARTRADDVVFSVSDNGPGVPEDQRERVFELFEQSDQDREGTGIGLAVCQRIVNRHSGEIWVESDDEGATFQFTLPLDATERSVQQPPQP